MTKGRDMFYLKLLKSYDQVTREPTSQESDSL